MKNEVLYIIVFLVSVFISAVSQIMLKKSADIEYESRLREYLNPRVLMAYVLFFASSLLTVLAYKFVPLSLGPILEASGYIYVAVLGMIFLKEHITIRKMLGMLCILVGIIVFYIM